jgi:hypothetical protein
MIYNNFNRYPGAYKPEDLINLLNYKKLLAGADFVLSLKIVV